MDKSELYWFINQSIKSNINKEILLSFYRSDGDFIVRKVTMSQDLTFSGGYNIKEVDWKNINKVIKEVGIPAVICSLNFRSCLSSKIPQTTFKLITKSPLES